MLTMSAGNGHSAIWSSGALAADFAFGVLAPTLHGFFYFNAVGPLSGVDIFGIELQRRHVFAVGVFQITQLLLAITAGGVNFGSHKSVVGRKLKA